MNNCLEDSAWRPPLKGGALRGKLKRTLASISRSVRSMVALFHRVLARRPRGKEPRPKVVLIEPPCLVAGSDCLVNVHLSQELGFSQPIRAATGGRDQAGTEVLPIGTTAKTVCIFLPNVKAWGSEVEWATGDLKEEGHQSPEAYWKPATRKVAAHSNDCDSAVTLLALPRDAAREVCELFEKMVTSFKRMLRNQASCVHTREGDCCTEDFWDERAVKAAVWTSSFRFFCSHFASTLEEMVSGEVPASASCVPLATYLAANGMWHAASFLLTTCLRSGARVTIGPFALSEDDLAAENLKTDLSVMGGGDVGLAVGYDA